MIDYKKALKDELIYYRNKLNLEKNITFGVEIEYEDIIKDYVDYYLSENKLYDKRYGDFINTYEPDIERVNEMGEVICGEVKTPILTDNVTSWKNLEWTLELLKRLGGNVTDKCGTHINIGSQILENNPIYFRNLFLIWTLYEKEIYTFSKGEFSRLRGCEHFKSLRPILLKNIDKIINLDDDIISYININSALFDKKHAFCLSKYSGGKYKKDNVIEFRVPNGTLNKEIIQNYINFFTKLLLATKQDVDIEEILYKIKNNQHDILSLAHLVFNDDLDKEYFLIQALKTNKVYNKKLKIHSN